MQEKNRAREGVDLSGTYPMPWFAPELIRLSVGEPKIESSGCDVTDDVGTVMETGLLAVSTNLVYHGA